MYPDSSKVARQAMRPLYAALLCCLIAGSALAQANTSSKDNGSDPRQDLEYGAVLFEYFQDNYFQGLIEQALALSNENSQAASHRGQLLEGSMALSYRLPRRAQTIFDELLADESDEATRNRAWYHLAKLYHRRSEPAEAFEALQNIRGQVPADLHLDYRYLSTLVARSPENLRQVQNSLDRIPSGSVQYPYLLFNLGISQLSSGDSESAINNLSTVVEYGAKGGEFEVLADRARHGLAQVAMAEERLEDAWTYLRDIRTEGLYSNRALLAYAWTAIRQELYDAAIPALQLLKQRSVALPEVQQGMVLLGHIYEQQEDSGRALKSLLDAEAKLLDGLEQLEQARTVIDSGELPRELSANLEAAGDRSDWEAVESSEGYQTLAPFLVDLIAGRPFQQINQELTDLYAIRDNLDEWERQAEQHHVILRNAAEKVFDDKMRKVIAESAKLNEQLADKRQELALLRLTLGIEEQARFEALFDNTKRELAQLNDKVEVLRRQSEPYRQPPGYVPMVEDHHQRIGQQQAKTDAYIARLEPLMRDMVHAELSKHEERMRYYLAQARLAKARLYDAALSKANKGDAAKSQGGSTQ